MKDFNLHVKRILSDAMKEIETLQADHEKLNYESATALFQIPVGWKNDGEKDVSTEFERIYQILNRIDVHFLQYPQP